MLFPIQRRYQDIRPPLRLLLAGVFPPLRAAGAPLARPPARPLTHPLSCTDAPSRISPWHLCLPEPTQTDVTAKVNAERHIALVSETEHRLLEQVRLSVRQAVRRAGEGRGGRWVQAGRAGCGLRLGAGHHSE